MVKRSFVFRLESNTETLSDVVWLAADASRHPVSVDIDDKQRTLAVCAAL